MNIKDAKEQIKKAIVAYFTKDEIEYVTNSSGGFGMLFSLDEKAAIPF